MNTDTIEKSFSKFCKPEELAGNNKYFCEKCNARHNSTKKLSFDKCIFNSKIVPRVLIIHLKRFDNFGRKVKKYIQYGNDLNLNFLKNNINSNEDVRYRLYAVLVHEGFSTFSGHYYCYVKNSNDVWYCMNDSDVRQVPEKSILNQTPYLLFYERVINYQAKYNIDNHIKRLKNEPLLKENNGNGSESTTTTDSDTIEKIEEKKESKPKKTTKEIKENSIARANSIPNNLVRSNSIVSDIDNMLTRSVSLNFFMNSNEVPRFVSKNMKRLLKLRRLQTLSLENKNKCSVVIPNEKKEEEFLEPFPIIDKEDSKVKKVTSDAHITYDSNKKLNNNSSIIKKKISELYGSGNISLWDDNENDALKKQYCFIKKEKLDKENEVLKKDQYDIDYDKGRTKKIKKKVAFRKNNVFQRTQNRNNLSRKIH